jgi:phage terminase Nu1 subunit (DNA packaging protein)
MGAEPEAGTVSAAQAMMLLLLEPADLKQLERAGAFRPIAPGRYGLVDLVQGFARHVRKADALVSSAALARHFDCVPAYIRKLVEQGVIERRNDGRFDLDQCRAKYLAHLRAERARSPKSAADTEFASAKAELIRIRIAEKKRDLVRQDQVDELIEDMMGVILPALSSMPARCAPRGDLATRRAIERVVFEVRSELAAIAQRKAEEAGEPNHLVDVAG